MIEINVQDVRQYESDLKTFAKRAYPFATRETIMNAAVATQKKAREGVSQSMTLRNAFTRQSIQFSPKNANRITLDVNNQAAVVGSIADYLATQEFGGSVAGAAGNKSIATGYSAGQGSAQPRTRLPRKPDRMAAIKLKRRGGKAYSRKQRNLMAVKQAAAGGSKYIFMDLGRREGIFKVTGGKRKPRVNMVWDMTQRAVQVPRSPWLAPATRDTEQQLPAFYAQALAFQLQRHGLFRG